MATKGELQAARDNAAKLQAVFPRRELASVLELCRGEEGSFFIGKLAELVNVFTNAPKIGATDSMGDSATVIAHYFGGFDWYITEVDVKTGEAFGLVRGYETELGYIDIGELLDGHGFLAPELDLHWTPKTLAEVKARMR